MTETDGGPASRQELLRRLVTRMAGVATRLVPDGEGAHLRFINRARAHDHLGEDGIDDALRFEPRGRTPIGTELRRRVLGPFVLDVFARGERLQRPVLVLVVTDGHPTEDPAAFRDAIVECGRALAEKGYEPEGGSRSGPFGPLTCICRTAGADAKPQAVRFLVSRIGRDEKAAEFLDSVGGDVAIERVVHRTSGKTSTLLS